MFIIPKNTRKSVSVSNVQVAGFYRICLVSRLAGFESRIPKRQRGRRDQLHKLRGPFAGLRLERFESGPQMQQNIMKETVWFSECTTF
ncbi:hypothetical protein B9Z55_013791 [Caenorhabditis nigoni]|nr:hypothetical protein B9Z55_013791 [Caenorhabditis nigoni]